MNSKLKKKCTCVLGYSYELAGDSYYDERGYFHGGTRHEKIKCKKCEKLKRRLL